jgi:signal transduction histidine kinase
VSEKKIRKKSDLHAAEAGRQNDASATAYAIAGGIAHDLNTILTAIYGYSELAQESAGDAAATEKYLMRIIGAADRAKSLTAQLIDLSRGALQPPQRVNVGEILEDAVRFLRPSADDNITITEKISAPELHVDAVPAQLFRLFINIAANALKAMEEKGGRLVITLEAVSDLNGIVGEAADTALVRFADNGRGMDRETTERLFEPFYSKGEGAGGTGLGMMVVRAIINDLGGAVRVNSNPGAGTVVELLIPLSGFGPVDEKSYLRKSD